jgi:formate hydrogenlyase subunit 6/NADH:ubiquinone oxidoreductase subunit I
MVVTFRGEANMHRSKCIYCFLDRLLCQAEAS